MKTIIAKRTNSTPGITLDYDNGILRIEGNSFSLEPELFWSVVMHQINKIKNNIDIIEVELNHISADSTSYLLRLINMSGIAVNWIYNISDDDMYELGKDLESISKSEFDFYMITEEEIVEEEDFCVC